METGVHGQLPGRASQAAGHKVLMELKSMKWDTPPKLPPWCSGRERLWMIYCSQGLSFFLSLIICVNWKTLDVRALDIRFPVCWCGSITICNCVTPPIKTKGSLGCSCICLEFFSLLYFKQIPYLHKSIITPIPILIPRPCHLYILNIPLDEPRVNAFIFLN